MTAATANDRALFEIKDLKKYYPIRGGFLSRTKGYVKAVDGVDLTIGRGETLGLVGESGCGKTTLGRSIIQAIPPTSGQVLYRQDGKETVDLARLNRAQLKPIRRSMQYVFQDPFGSLNPRMTLLDIVGEPLVIHNAARGAELKARVGELLKMVGLRPEYMSRYPHAFSGGQRQRIGIARALSLNPQFVVCDEPVSALDVSVQAQILNLLKDLGQQMGVTYLFVAHDLSVVEYISDRVAVMYVGQVVELAPTEELYAHPLHPYTGSLLSAVSRPDPRDRAARVPLLGEIASAAHPPSGCYFHPRCQYAQGFCKVELPGLRELAPGHSVRCHLADKLQIPGAVAVKVLG